METLNSIEVFEQIIRHQGAEELVPFLLGLDKQKIVAIRKRVQTLASELEDIRQKGEQHWEKGPTPLQRSLFFLTRLATYSKKEALAPAFTNSLWELNKSRLSSGKSQYLPHDKLVDYACQLLVHRRPEWLDTWLGNTAESRPLRSLDFDLLLKLESHALIIPTNKLLALSGINELSNYGTEANALWQLHGYLKANVKLTASQLADFTQLTKAFPSLREGESLPIIEDLLFERITRNKALLERAIPQFFEFDTEINWGVAQTVNHIDRRWITWHDMLARLTATHHLDRADILTRCLLALRRDFRRPLLTWFKELFLSLKPTRAERLARQAELMELLAHPLPLVVNFAIEQVKDLLPEPGFTLAPLLQMADNLLLRPDLKTGLKTLLAGLAKLPRHDAAHAPAVARLLAAALAHPDAAVQERAAKALAYLLAAKKPLLPPADTAETLDALAHQAELLGAAARAVLAPWLAAPTPAPTAEATATYAPLAQFVPDISPATAIAPVADWHELLFLTGQVLRHDAPAALERWLDGLLRLHGQLPEGHAKQLEPYLVQVLPFLQGKSGEQAKAILVNIDLRGHSGLAQALLLSWAQGFTSLRVPRVKVQVDSDASDPLVVVEKARLAAVETHLQQRTGLPLLSTPTHAPYWVAPTAFLQKLLAYEAAQVEPVAADLAIALARLAFAHEPDAQAALAVLPQLQNSQLRELLHWLLSPEATEPPRHATEKKPLFQHLTEQLHQLLPGHSAAPGTLAEAWPWLWVVAARSKFSHPIFDNLLPAGTRAYPGIAQPWVPAWDVDFKVNIYVKTWKPGKPEITPRSTHLRFPSEDTTQGPPSPLLLYSLHVQSRGRGHANWILPADYPFLAALLPLNPTSLHWHVVRTAGWADKLESADRDSIAQALRALVEAGPSFAEGTTLLLAVGLVHHAPVCRALAQEVVLSAVGQQRLESTALGAALGRLLAADYAPLARLADNLALLRAISPVTDDALAQMLDALLPALPPAPLRNLRKLLETYADLGARTGRPVPPAVQDRLREWSQTGALKKLAVSLLQKAS
ncbi:DUF6493 family protein [Hymenobacter psoromatis]|uniref:DUF6493 family protein n=1 Tax=Hymenobacter psoromatis TaxID=1484116 RepID=UPI001CC18C2D|nr:DUF6493 family protein [Hymenobacter psoromatis]